MKVIGAVGVGGADVRVAVLGFGVALAAVAADGAAVAEADNVFGNWDAGIVVVEEFVVNERG